MNENQHTKFKNRLLNIQTQIQSGANILGKATIEEQIKTKLLQASKLIRDAYDMTDGIVTREVPKAESQKIRQKKESKYTALVPHEGIVDQHEEPTYNLKCRNYGEIRYKDGKVERTCIVGMDMCYCSVKCAYATNNVCSLKG